MLVHDWDEEVGDRRMIVSWLALVISLIILLIIVGGITRLTESGLSIVDWNLFMGVVPPLNETDWESLFARYKLYPQFQQLNSHMTLDDFKYIFYWEYFHRLLGRLVGVVYFIPLCFFQLRGYLSPRASLKLWIGLLLGGLQGLLGWYMVKSGLINIPRVSHYRLAAHLGFAFFLIAYLVWVLLDFLPKNRRAIGAFAGRTDLRGFQLSCYGFLLVLSVQIGYGAFVAGLRAGYGFNTFPLMGDTWVPASLWDLEPFWLNFLENNWGVQFVHRSLAWVVLLFALALYRYSKKFALHNGQARLVLAVVATVILQFVLGVMTLLKFVPLGLASLHQLGAVLLFGLVICLCHSLRNVPS